MYMYIHKYYYISGLHIIIHAHYSGLHGYIIVVYMYKFGLILDKDKSLYKDIFPLTSKFPFMLQ